MYRRESVSKLCLSYLLLFLAIGGACLTSTSPAAASDFPDDSVFQLKTFEDDTGTHNYALFLPQGYDKSDKPWPVVLFLHGAGERGNDGVAPTRIGLGAAIQERPEMYPFIAVFPQVEDMEGRYLEGWLANSSDGSRAVRILDDVINQYNIDSDRQILTGWSMGGYGVWSVAAQSPERWSAVMPLSGGGRARWAEALADTPIWNFHGQRDLVVLPDESSTMQEAFEQLGRPHHAQFTFLEEAGHDIWRHVYGYKAVVSWMLDPVPANQIDMTKAEPLVNPLPAPFVPALEMRRAARVRVNNEALEMFSYALPAQIPTNMLSGQLENIRTTATVEGRSFDVLFSDVTYKAEMYRTVLETTAEKTLSFKLGFRKIDVNLGRGAVRGEGRSADTGPINIQLGTREPVWLDIRMEPYIESRRIKLRNRGATLILGQSNMQVTPPAGVSVDGFGMTRERVSRGLVNGLYGSQGRIQQEIEQVAPRLVRELERRLDLNEIVKDRSSIWPLPVHAPRIELEPESILVDEKGFEMTLNLLVASFTERGAPEEPRILENEVDLNLGGESALEFSVATTALTEAMRLLIDEGLAHVDVEDIPGESFDRWGKREFWQELLGPDAEPIPPGPLRVLLTLNEPLNFDTDDPATASDDSSVVDQGGKKDDDSEVLSVSPGRMLLPDVRLTLATRNRQRFSRRWKSFCHLRIDLAQPFLLSFLQPDHCTREIRIGFRDEMQVKVTPIMEGDGDVFEIDHEMAAAEFRKPMQQWLAKATEQGMLLSDLDMRRAGLRASRLLLKPGQLGVGFDTPVVRIVNNTEEPQTYQTKGPFSEWSKEWVLPPREEHHFTVPYPMLYRRTAGEVEELYTLPLGADAEFRRDPNNPEKQGLSRLYLRPRRSGPRNQEGGDQITNTDPEVHKAQ